MKKLRFIYNPVSGDQNFIYSIDEAVDIFQKAGYDAHLFRTGDSSIDELFARTPKGEYDAVVVSGGDGTLNRVANALLRHGHDIPIGVIPSGTANDFANFLEIPPAPAAAAEIIARGNVIPCDAGKVNGSYFVNVFEAGALSNISQSVDADLKSAFGKLAYYMKGFGQLQNLAPLPMRITNSKETVEAELFMALALNTRGAGGFGSLAPQASICDGLFDFVAIKARPIMELAVLFLKILTRDFLDDPNIIFFQDSFIKIEPLFDDPAFFVTDTDGEAGPLLPVTVENLHGALRFFAP